MIVPRSPAVLEQRTTATPLTLAHTDWLRNVLAASGPTGEMGRFRTAAAGSGVTSWVLDLDHMEEDWFLSLASPPDGARAISVQGAKILARRLRDAAAANHGAALARMATDRSCPFDLHRLLPVPPAILALGPEEGMSRDWLRAHWGVTRPLRHVQALPSALDRRKKKMGQMRMGFWSADWSPWAAVALLRRAWPELSFELQPHYPGGAGEVAAGGQESRPPSREQKGRNEKARVGARRGG